MENGFDIIVTFIAIGAINILAKAAVSSAFLPEPVRSKAIQSWVVVVCLGGCRGGGGLG